MKTALTALIVALMGLGIFTASIAHADPWTPQPQPTPWNGQLQPTWDQPGYPGWNSGPTLCNPINLTCRGIAPNPN